MFSQKILKAKCIYAAFLIFIAQTLLWSLYCSQIFGDGQIASSSFYHLYLSSNIFLYYHINGRHILKEKYFWTVGSCENKMLSHKKFSSLEWENLFYIISYCWIVPTDIFGISTFTRSFIPRIFGDGYKWRWRGGVDAHKMCKSSTKNILIRS